MWSQGTVIVFAEVNSSGSLMQNRKRSEISKYVKVLLQVIEGNKKVTKKVTNINETFFFTRSDEEPDLGEGSQGAQDKEFFFANIFVYFIGKYVCIFFFCKYIFV